MVRGLVQQQQIRSPQDSPRQRKLHPPTTRQFQNLSKSLSIARRCARSVESQHSACMQGQARRNSKHIVLSKKHLLSNHSTEYACKAMHASTPSAPRNPQAQKWPATPACRHFIVQTVRANKLHQRHLHTQTHSKVLQRTFERVATHVCQCCAKRL